MPSYATQIDATIYFASRLGTECWDDAISEDKDKALGQATHIIDRLNFVGCKNDVDQVNQFPRDTDTVVPDDVKNASIEIALALIDGVNPELEFENLFMTSQGYGGARSSYDRSVKPSHVLAGVPSFTAWTFLKPYLRDPHSMELRRTS